MFLPEISLTIKAIVVSLWYKIPLRELGGENI